MNPPLKYKVFQCLPSVNPMLVLHPPKRGYPKASQHIAPRLESSLTSKFDLCSLCNPTNLMWRWLSEKETCC